MRAYTGVGSRETPEEIVRLMRKIGYKLARMGYTLRSGGAEGADQAFEAGWWHWHQEDIERAEPCAEIYIPWNGFSNRHHGCANGAYTFVKNMEEALEVASVIHPAWNAKKRDGSPVLSPVMKNMHARNCFQVLGLKLDDPADFLICWAPPIADGTVKGGTRTAYVLAKNNGIPCFNLYEQEHKDRLEIFVEDIAEIPAI